MACIQSTSVSVAGSLPGRRLSLGLSLRLRSGCGSRAGFWAKRQITGRR